MFGFLLCVVSVAGLRQGFARSLLRGPPVCRFWASVRKLDPLQEGVCLGYVMNRDRQKRGASLRYVMNQGSPNEGAGLRDVINRDRLMWGRVKFGYEVWWNQDRQPSRQVKEYVIKRDRLKRGRV